MSVWTLNDLRHVLNELGNALDDDMKRLHVYFKPKIQVNTIIN